MSIYRENDAPRKGHLEITWPERYRSLAEIAEERSGLTPLLLPLRMLRIAPLRYAESVSVASAESGLGMA